MIKKEYITPTIEQVKINATVILAGSGEDAATGSTDDELGDALEGV